MEIVICIIMFSMGFVCGMYAASQAETHIDNKVNPKMKMSKKELGITEDEIEDEDEIEYSCCGDEMTGILKDIQMCPTCKEHQ